MTIISDAIDGMILAWHVPHVFMEVFEPILPKPTLANFDAAPSVSFPSSLLWVGAALDHAGPDAIDLAYGVFSGHPVAPIDRADALSLQTAARSCHTAAKVGAPYFRYAAARALTHPMHLSGVLAFCAPESDQSPEALAFYVANGFTHDLASGLLAAVVWRVL